MGILYQLLHQTYKLRHPVLKKAPRLGRLRKGPEPRVHAGTHIDLDFLFPNSVGHESLRDHYVVRASLLRFMVKYWPSFLFFKTEDLAPNQRIIPLSFKMLKLSYQGVEELDAPATLPLPASLTEDWTPDMFSLFRYKFTQKHFVSAYTTVRLSARHKHRVSQLAFLYALLVRLSQHDFEQVPARLHLICPSLPQDFIRLMDDEPVMASLLTGASVVHPPLPLASIAGLESRRAALASALALEESDSEYTSSDESESDDAEPAGTEAEGTEAEGTEAEGTEAGPALAIEYEHESAFHRYVLAGQGVDHGLTTPTRGVLNTLYNKGRTPRNKQIYRTGVFWCLWLTVLTVVGPFYVFYGFTFMYTHLYLFPLAVLARLALVAVMRFFDLSAKQLWFRLYNYF